MELEFLQSIPRNNTRKDDVRGWDAVSDLMVGMGDQESWSMKQNKPLGSSYWFVVALVNLFWWVIPFNGGTREWEAWTFSAFENFFPLWNLSSWRLEFHMDFLSTSVLPPPGTRVLEFLHWTWVSEPRDTSLQNSFKNLPTNKIVKKIMLNGKKSPCSVHTAV